MGKCKRIVEEGYFDYGPCDQEGAVKVGRKNFCHCCAQKELQQAKVLAKKAKRVWKNAQRKERIILKQMSKESISWYDKNGKNFEQRTMELDMNSFYEPFLCLLGTNAIILDAGCGPGRDTKEFLRRGYKVLAFDGSSEMAKIATQNTGIQVQACRFNEFKTTERIDGIWACASLLHVPHLELPHTLRYLMDTLCPLGGIIFLSLKMGSGEKFEDGRWFFYHNEGSIKELARNLGLSIVKLWQTKDMRKDKAGTEWLNVILSSH